MNLKLKNPLILALDVDDKSKAVSCAQNLGPHLGAIKLGPRLVYRYGQEFVQEIAQHAPVFIDNKYFDIPSTMLAAVKASFEAGATLVTVHALAGSEALQQLAQLEKELNQKRPFKILCVTILTSWDENSIPKVMKNQKVIEHVSELIQLVRESGLTGIVCSGSDLPSLKTKGLFMVTPGIRLQGAAASDQKRTVTPAEAISNGAHALVIGRPLLEAKDPQELIQQILHSLP